MKRSDNMSEKYYTIFNCTKCNKEMILITDDLKNIEIKCAYCSCKRLKVEGKYDSIKDCMNNRR